MRQGDKAGTSVFKDRTNGKEAEHGSQTGFTDAGHIKKIKYTLSPNSFPQKKAAKGRKKD